MHDDIRRSITAVSIGTVKDIDKRDARRRELGQRETVQMFQAVIAGEAGNVLAFSEIGVSFDYYFYFSPGTHDSDLEVPNFAWGAAELDADVVVTAYVLGWTRDPDTDTVTGATVRIGAVSPGVDAPVSFSGKMHLQFTGWASLYEDETEITE